MKEMKNTENQSLKKILVHLYEEKDFFCFDTFITNKMLGKREKNFSIELRKQAFRLFCKRIGERQIASVPTMKKWFGIGGYAEPKREQIFELAFVLKLTVEELNEYLVDGLFSTSLQINDYKETFFGYGLENDYQYEDCLQMIDSFERHMAGNVTISHTSNTSDLLQQFCLKRSLSKSLFMEWMLANAGSFKGYSNTTLEYFKKYKKIVLKHVREDMKDCLETILSSTDYYTWKTSHSLRKESEGERIRKYIYNKHDLPEEKRKEILEQVSFVYFEKDSNVHFLLEVFSSRLQEKNRRFSPVQHMTEKYLSDLLNIATQKEREIYLSQAESYLDAVRSSGKENEVCPQWIVDLLYNNASTNDCAKKEITVQEAMSWVMDYRKEHRRRVIQIERSDMLPLIQYVAVQRYMNSIQLSLENYDYMEARSQFIELADYTLAACNMAKFSEKYELDALLLACFQPDEWYLYSEVLEQLEKMKRE